MASPEPPNPPAGYACFETEFGGNAPTARNYAEALGYEVVQAQPPALGWYYAVREAFDVIRQAFADQAAAYEESRRIDGTFISDLIASPYLGYSAKHFADSLGLTSRKPSEAEGEWFVRIDDLPAIVAECRRVNPAPQGSRARNDPETEERIVAWARSQGRPGATAAAWWKAFRSSGQA